LFSYVNRTYLLSKGIYTQASCTPFISNISQGNYYIQKMEASFANRIDEKIASGTVKTAYEYWQLIALHQCEADY